jgi:cytochrome c-type biogenesis protein CcmH
MRGFILSVLMSVMFLPVLAFAQSADVEIENRARDIGQSLRCVVCQNQSIDESDAPLAQDMRKLVRKRLSEGDSNDEVIAYMRDKYGDYVLLKPPVQTNTYLLWLLPFAVMLSGLIWFFLSGSSSAAKASEDKEEQT